MNKEKALHQIDSIYRTIRSNFMSTVPANYMIAVGIAIMAIPLVQYMFSHAIDSVITSSLSRYASPVIFALRTIFYWSFFIILPQFFPEHSQARQDQHPVIQQIWSLGQIFPIIPISTAAVLGYAGYSSLIMPVVLILVGCVFGMYGRFLSPIVTTVAWGYIIAGLVGIHLTSYHIPNLWIYLLIYQGAGCIAIGLFLHYAQRQTVR